MAPSRRGYSRLGTLTRSTSLIATAKGHRHRLRPQESQPVPALAALRLPFVERTFLGFHASGDRHIDRAAQG
jgi:hypothetical protein